MRDEEVVMKARKIINLRKKINEHMKQKKTERGE
jgi:hypothetical protein